MAGRPRLAAGVASVTGADKRSPGRFVGRAAPKVMSLGPAPKAYGKDKIELWNEFNSDFPWLGRSDRGIVKMAVLLQSQIDAMGMDTPPAMIAQMRLLLSSMGGTPVDRSKVGKVDGEPDDPTDEFLN